MTFPKARHSQQKKRKKDTITKDTENKNTEKVWRTTSLMTCSASLLTIATQCHDAIWKSISYIFGFICFLAAFVQIENLKLSKISPLIKTYAVVFSGNVIGIMLFLTTNRLISEYLPQYKTPTLITASAISTLITANALQKEHAKETQHEHYLIIILFLSFAILSQNEIATSERFINKTAYAD